MCIQNTKKIHKLAGVEQGRTGQKNPTAYYTHILNKVILFNNIFILENLKSDIWWGGGVALKFSAPFNRTFNCLLDGVPEVREAGIAALEQVTLGLISPPVQWR